jgi:hypothetical protein
MVCLAPKTGQAEMGRILRVLLPLFLSLRESEHVSHERILGKSLEIVFDRSLRITVLLPLNE